MKQLGLGALCLALAFAALASDDSPSQPREPATERDFASDHVAAGRTVTVTQPVAGDLMAAGGQVNSTAEVGGSALLAGGQVQAGGLVKDNLYLAGGQLTVNGQVGRNARVAGGKIEFTAPSEVAGNLSVGGGEVTLKGRVNGYVMAGAGELLIDGTVGGDVEARAGEITLGPNARIAGKLHYASNNELKRDPAAQVQGEVKRLNDEEVWPMQGGEMGRHAAGGGHWVWTVGLMVVAAVLASALPAWADRMAVTWRSRFPFSLLMGFVLLVCVPAAVILLLVTLIGVPLGLMTMAAYPVLLMLGYVSSGVALGLWAAARYRPAWTQATWGRVGAAMLGMLAIAVLARIPWLGGLVVLAALLAGMGALVLQSWQTRNAGAAHSA